MRVAAIYDIHANLPALEAVLEEIRRANVDQIVVGGDVLPGPMPDETLARLFDLDVPTQFIRGNGDRVILTLAEGRESSEFPSSYREAMDWNARQLGPDAVRRVAAWPPTIRVRIPPLGDVLFCHATPRNDTEIFTRLTPEERLRPIFEPTGAALVVCGHIHMQFDRMIGKVRVVNAGSVGMPFTAPGAYWLLLGPTVQLERTAYDLAKAAERVRASRYPLAEDFAARNILQPPSEEAMIQAFTPAEIDGLAITTAPPGSRAPAARRDMV
jgi:putative phosphoesterase